MAKELPKNLKKQIEDSSQTQQTKNLVEHKYGTLTKNQEYWKERSERRILEAEKTADEITRDLKVLYADTIERINKEIEALFGRYQTETGLTMEELRKLLTPDELKKFRAEALKYYENLSKYAYDPSYRERLRNQIYTTTTKENRKLYSLRRNVSRLDYLKMQMENAIETLYAQEYAKITKGLKETYKETYMRSMFDTQQAIGVFTPFNALNEKLVNKAVQQKWLGDNYSDRIWSDKNKLINTLETTFVQDIALGKNPRAIASDIKKETGVKYRNCERLARTEFNNVANSAAQDSYIDAGLEKYVYVATLDFRTSNLCAENDGKIYNVKDAEVGINYPPLHPNCYIEGTEVFTNKGWKKLEDCKIFDMCLSWNLKKNKYEFTPVIKTISRKVNEDLLHFSCKDKLNVIVTSDHNMVIGTLIGNFELRGLVPAYTNLKIGKIFKKDYYFYLGNGEKIRLSDIEIKSIPYDGYVYCVELLKNHTLLVRYNNCVCWCGNCRSTTIPYLEDLDYSKIERIATGADGKAYYVSADMSYADWRASLSEKDNQMIITQQKMDKQYNADKKQIAEYRKLATQANKAGMSELFENMPRDVQSWQKLKYTDPETYQIYVSNAKIARSALKD